MEINAIIDIVLLVIAVVIIAKITAKGFFVSIFDSCKLILSILLAYLLRLPIAKLFNSWFMSGAITGLISDSLTTYANGGDALLDVVGLYTLVPGFFNNILIKFGIDTVKLQADMEALSKGDATVINSLSSNIGEAAATMLSTALAVFAIFFASMIILSIIIKALNLLTKFEGIKTANKLLGFVFGVLIAAAVLWGICIGLEILSSKLGSSYPQYIGQEVLDKSLIYNLFKQLNLLERVKALIP